MKHKFSLLAGAAILLSVSSSSGEPVSVTHVNAAQGDFLFIPDDVWELGENGDNGGGGPGFGSQFLIDARFVGLAAPSLPATNGPGPDARISIENLSGISWEDLWYVADMDTSISNYDGFIGTSPKVPSLFSFKINPGDAPGVNNPLLSESMTSDGIFEPGEKWEFVLQDFSSTLNPGLIQSRGLGDGDSPIPPADDASSGSILGVPVGGVIPEPSRVVLLLLGLVAMVSVRRR